MTNIVKNIIGSNKIRCWECERPTERSEAHYYYHGDQDDLVCTNCAKKLKHTDTVLRGMNVFKTG